jgi:hypothetical protein
MYTFVEFYLVAYSVVEFVESRETFRRKMSPSSSGLNIKISKKLACSRQAVLAVCVMLVTWLTVQL